jgi:hypothetical protein
MRNLIEKADLSAENLSIFLVDCSVNLGLETFTSPFVPVKRLGCNVQATFAHLGDTDKLMPRPRDPLLAILFRKRPLQIATVAGFAINEDFVVLHDSLRFAYLTTYTKAQAVMKQNAIMASSPHAFAKSIHVTRNEFSSIADAPPAGALPPTFDQLPEAEQIQADQYLPQPESRQKIMQCESPFLPPCAGPEDGYPRVGCLFRLYCLPPPGVSKPTGSALRPD